MHQIALWASSSQEFYWWSFYNKKSRVSETTFDKLLIQIRNFQRIDIPIYQFKEYHKISIANILSEVSQNSIHYLG